MAENIEPHVGITGIGVYIPEGRMSAEEIAEKTEGEWEPWAVKEKLGIKEKVVPGENDGTQAMGVAAAREAVESADVDPKDIDIVLGIGEEWKEYPLTTSSIYIQEQVGAKNAWAIDVQQRCGTTVAALKLAEDLLLGNQEYNKVLIAGGYRNIDLVDYSDPELSMMYNLAAAGGALIVEKNCKRNVLEGTHLISDGSMARDVGVKVGGVAEPATPENAEEAYTLRMFDVEHMKTRLEEVSIDNWLYCIEQAFSKAGRSQEEMDYLAVLHFKPSMHEFLLDQLNLSSDQTTYLDNYGHTGQIDQILSLKLGLENGKVKPGSIISMISAGIGYAWAANVIKWGDINNKGG